MRLERKVLTDAIQERYPEGNMYGLVVGSINTVVTGLSTSAYKARHYLHKDDSVYDHLSDEDKATYRQLEVATTDLILSGFSPFLLKGKLEEMRRDMSAPVEERVKAWESFVETINQALADGAERISRALTEYKDRLDRM